MKVAEFDPAGGPIFAEVQCAPQRDGAYELKLWEAGVNQVIHRQPGNFINTDDDRYELPGSSADHDGRIVEVVATVAVPPGTGPCTVRLVITQDEQRLEQSSVDVPPNSPIGLADVFIQLVGAT